MSSQMVSARTLCTYAQNFVTKLMSPISMPQTCFQPYDVTATGLATICWFLCPSPKFNIKEKWWTKGTGFHLPSPQSSLIILFKRPPLKLNQGTLAFLISMDRLVMKNRETLSAVEELVSRSEHKRMDGYSLLQCWWKPWALKRLKQEAQPGWK